MYGDVRIQLTADPPRSARGETVTARLSLRNTGSEEVELESVCPELAFVHVERDGERVPMSGAGGNCFNAMTSFGIPAGQELTESWTIRITRRDGGPVSPGIYQLRTQFLVDELPDVEATLRVE